MKGLFVKPYEMPISIEFENTLKNLQELVDGYIQVTYPFTDHNVVLVCDEKGKLKQKPVNRVILSPNGNLYDIIVGAFLILGINEEDDFESLDDIQIEMYTEMFSRLEVFLDE